MKELFKHIATDSNSEQFENERAERRIHFDQKYRDEFDKIWNLYKNDKLKNSSKQSSTSSKSTISDSDYLTIDPEKLDNFGKSLFEIKSLYDMVDSQSMAPSKDQLAFELFDFALNHEYTDYQSELEKQIYGDDGYEQGYKNQIEMSNKFKDIFDYDHPSAKKQLFSSDDANLREALRGVQGNDQRFDYVRSDSLAAIDPLAPENSQARSQSAIKFKTYEYTNNSSEKSLEQSMADADDIVSDFVSDVQKDTDASIRRQSKTEAQPYDYETKVTVKERKEYSELSEREAEFMSVEKLVSDSKMNALYNVSGDSDRFSDSYNIKKFSFDNNLHSMQHELKYAVKTKREYAMDLALKVFNKIQGISMSHTSTNDAEISHEYQTEIDNNEYIRLDDSLSEKLDTKLSNLKNAFDPNHDASLLLIKSYHQSGLLGLDEHQIQNLVDKNAKDFENATENLEKVYEQLDQKEAEISAIRDAYDQGIKYYRSKEKYSNLYFY